MNRIKLAALFGCALLLTARAASAADARVTIDNFAFAPPQLVVSAGTRVIWTNQDDMPHTVVDTMSPHAIQSPPLDTGDSYAHVFDKSGTFHYFCSIHPYMQGTVVVR
jgi:plastocyanin